MHFPCLHLHLLLYSPFLHFLEQVLLLLLAVLLFSGGLFFIIGNGIALLEEIAESFELLLRGEDLFRVQFYQVIVAVHLFAVSEVARKLGLHSGMALG
jgi:hypothetical protein